MYYIPLHQPIAPEFLDDLLALGWYRMSQHVFTTQIVELSEEEAFEVLWARINLKRWSLPPRYERLIKKCGHLHIQLGDAQIDDNIEGLYRLYRQFITFDSSQSVRHYLQEDKEHNFFPTKLWQVFDGDQLVAASYFDEGEKTVAGIMSFFHPQYKKYSLGLLQYLHTVKWAAENKKDFFYPGYIAINNAKFDYKLLAGTSAIEIWDPNNLNWHAYAESKHAHQPL